MDNDDMTGTESLSNRLAAIDDRIARMRSLNATKGDAMALRLIEDAQVERRMVLAQIPAASARKS